MIKVTEDYLIDIDSRNYIAKRDTHKKIKLTDPTTNESKEIDHLKVLGFYNNLSGAIKGIVEDMNKRQLKKEAKTLEDAIMIIKRNNERFEELLNKVLLITEELPNNYGDLK